MGVPHLTWEGPYPLWEIGRHYPEGTGIYVWTVQIDGLWYPLDVGESHTSLSVRLLQHKEGLVKPRDYVYDPECLRRGEVKALYHSGMANPPDEVERAAKAEEFGRLISFFALPVEKSRFESNLSLQRICERIEAEVALRIKDDPEGRRIFSPTWRSYRPRCSDETAFPVHTSSPHPIVGLRSVMWV